MPFERSRLTNKHTSTTPYASQKVKQQSTILLYCQRIRGRRERPNAQENATWQKVKVGILLTFARPNLQKTACYISNAANCKSREKWQSKSHVLDHLWGFD